MGNVTLVVLLNGQRERLVAVSPALDGSSKGGCAILLHIYLFAGYGHLVCICSTSCNQDVITIGISKIADIDGYGLGIGGSYVIGVCLCAVRYVNRTWMSGIPVPITIVLILFQQETACCGFVWQFPLVAF